MKKHPPKYHVTLFWDLEMDVHRTSKIVTGLLDLARRSKVVLLPRIGLSASETGRPPGGVFAWLEIRRVDDQRLLKIAIDLHDLSTLFRQEALEGCDVYLKKSFYPPDVAVYAGKWGHKVIPFGFNMPCTTSASKRMVWRWLTALYTRMVLHSPREAVAHFRAHLGHYRTWLDGPTMRDFEQLPEVAVCPIVVFQARVWSKEEVGPDNHEFINEQRAAIIRLLKKELGDQFIGGLVPTAYAKQHYPDILAEAPARRRQFIRWSKRNLIGVYVRGLNYSYGFRFAEHLAASQCIVAHPDGFRNLAPTPPQEGVHYLPFQTPEECLQQCRRLLEDGDLAASMRRANWQYYLQEVEPAQHVWNCLERAFAHVDSAR
jgi:hypothetical protein